MNTKEYIESGILEAYVLGALTKEERLEVEANVAMYPELAGELAAIERTMMHVAQDQAVEPPAFMQERIWAELEKDAPSVKPQPELVPEQPKTVPLPPQPAAKPSWQRAAVWAAVLVSALTNFMLLSQRNKSKDEQQVLTARIDSMSAAQGNLAAAIDMYKKQVSVLTTPGMQTVVMRKEGDSNMAGMVYWSKEKGDTYLALHNLPMPPQGKQYQLWVIQDGKPVDMGVITNDMVANGAMQKIPMSILSGQAFAISLEKEGGNPTPTQVYMVGATS